MTTPVARPFFSVLITAYNRAEIAERCVRSCSDQSFDDFEIVVVDDASTDGTPARLAELQEPRMRIVRHEHNRGISPARATAVEHARGEWLVIVDSDWELLPHTLTRLKELIDGLEPGVHIIRSRLRSDDGTLEPAVIPSGITDYRGRLLWCDAVAASGGPSDAGHCIHRSVFEAGNYFDHLRGEVETLWELDVARVEPSIWVPDVLGLQHTDAANSHLREASARRLIPRLLGEAPDTLWVVETLLMRHGEGLAELAPHYRLAILERGVQESLLAGHRRGALRMAVAAARAGGGGPRLWATVAAGLLGARPLAYAILAGRRWRARRPAT